jgi:hypothetical protein
MKPRTVGYGFTKNTGNYENVKVYLEYELDENDDIKDVFDKAESQALRLFDDEAEIKSKSRELNRLSRELVSLKSTIRLTVDQGIDGLSLIYARWQAAVELLERHGISVEEEFPQFNVDGLPEGIRSTLGKGVNEEELEDIPFEQADSEF